MDQLRGYAILGMIFVNFISRFDVVPWMLKHHREGMSYNDTIAPIFIFVVGMGFRLSFARRVAKAGLWPARRAAAKRYIILSLIGFAVYAGYFWDALTDIGIGGLLALPFIHRGRGVRFMVAALYLALFQAVYSWTGYGEWLMRSSMNGGPLGPLSWGAILIGGSLAYDLIATRDSGRIIRACLVWGLGLSVAGWALKMPWPGVKAEWPFSQYGMTAPYVLYAAGLCFLTLLAFHLVCDVWGQRIPHLTILGENPLLLYGLHALLILISLPILPKDASPPAILIGFACAYGVCYFVALQLHRRKIVVKI